MLSARLEAVYVWTWALEDWVWVWGTGGQEPIPTLDSGAPLYVYVTYRNTGTVNFIGRVGLTVTKPSGAEVKPPAYSGQDALVLPGSFQGVAFGPIYADQSGVFQALCKLEGER